MTVSCYVTARKSTEPTIIFAVGIMEELVIIAVKIKQATESNQS